MSRTLEHVTCLGCGCACDDIDVVVRDGRIAEARRACPLGSEWFGNGVVPAQVLVNGRSVDSGVALDYAASVLRQATRTMVFLSPDLSCEAQRAAVAIADTLRALLDSVTTEAAPSILAAQRRGRAGATLGEIRNRADVVVFWGVDPARRYPRFFERYAPNPVGLHVDGRGARTVVAVDLDDGDARGPVDADVRIRFSGAEELDAIGALRASLAGRATGGATEGLASRVGELAKRLGGARYATVVVDGEPGSAPNTGRSEALLSLVDTLNGVTRAALTTLRGGGNRSGADAVLTWQTGYPMSIDFARGYPTYRPDEGAARWLAAGTATAALVLGRWRPVTGVALPTDVVAIGPGASSAFPRAQVAIDTGVAGIHEGGTALRMDDVPLQLRAPLPGSLDTASVIQALAVRVGAMRGGS